MKCPDCGGPTVTTFVDTGESTLYETLVPGGYECANPQACRAAPKSPEVQAIDRAFYELTVKERDYERARADRLQRERDRARAEARFQEERAENLATEILSTVGDEWDAEDSADNIAVRYVRSLEAGIREALAGPISLRAKNILEELMGRKE